MGRQRGQCKWFNNEKGYGFITPESGGKDLFVHYTNISGEGYRSLQEGALVEYDLGESPKGPFANEVTVLNA